MISDTDCSALGPMLITACACLTIFHPGFALGDLWNRKQLTNATSKTTVAEYKLKRGDSGNSA